MSLVKRSHSEGATAVHIELKPWNNEKMAAGRTKMLSFSNLSDWCTTALTCKMKFFHSKKTISDTTNDLFV